MIRVRTALIFTFLIVIMFSGCRRELTPDVAKEVEVSGKVVGPDGKPLTGVRIGFVPTGGAAAANTFPLKEDGSFSGKLRAGTYAYVIIPTTEGDKKSEAVLKTLPETYTKTSLDRQVEVSGGAIELKF